MQSPNPEINLLLTLAKIEPSDDDAHTIERLIEGINDWDYFYKSALFHGVVALVSKNLIPYADKLPKHIMHDINQSYLQTLSRNIILYKNLQNILQLFADKHIDIIPLKGIYLAETVYKDIGLRQMSDIDLLIKKQDAEKAVSLLTDMGYKTFEEHKSRFMKEKGVAKHLPTMMLNGVMVELHYRVLVDNTLHEINMTDYWDNAMPVKLAGTDTLSLSPEHLLQYLCIHLERHFNEGKLQLIHFVDLVEMLKKYRHDMNWQQFEVSCVKNQCVKNVFRILSLLQNHFGISFTERISNMCRQYKDESAEQLFLSYLHGEKEKVAMLTDNINIRNLNKIDGNLNKLKYLLGDLFPSRTFMTRRYNIYYRPLVFVYYMIRPIKGLYLLIQHFIKKLY